MHLFNASSLFNEEGVRELISVANDPDKLKEKMTHIKRILLETYHLKTYNVPEDFTTNSYLVAANHLTDSDAPLIISYYFEVMHKVKSTYPEMLTFAKENCFNGVSIPKELTPVLALEKIVGVDRTNSSGSMVALKKAIKWYNEGEQPKHFLIFPQGTIYDINKDQVEDIEKGAFWLAAYLGIPVLPAFLEQPVEGEENRLIFAEPITIPKDCKDFEPYKALWIERVIEAQNSLERLNGVPAREAVLDEEHQTRKRFKVC